MAESAVTTDDGEGGEVLLLLVSWSAADADVLAAAAARSRLRCLASHVSVCERAKKVAGERISSAESDVRFPVLAPPPPVEVDGAPAVGAFPSSTPVMSPPPPPVRHRERRRRRHGGRFILLRVDRRR